MFFHNYREITVATLDVEIIAKRANDVRNTLDKKEDKSEQEEVDLVNATQLTKDAEGVLGFLNKSGEEYIRLRMG